MLLHSAWLVAGLSSLLGGPAALAGRVRGPMAHEFALKVLADVMLVGVTLLFLWRGVSNVVAGWRNTKKKLGKQD